VTTTATLATDRKEKVKERWRVPFLILLALIPIASSAYFDVPDFINAMRSQQWPVVGGKIERCDSELSKVKLKEVAFDPVVEYSYNVNGIAYKNDRIKFQKDIGLGGYEAFKLKDRYHAGDPVAVRYDISDPQNSVIDTNASFFRVFSHFILYAMFSLLVYLSTYPCVSKETALV